MFFYPESIDFVVVFLLLNIKKHLQSIGLKEHRHKPEHQPFIQGKMLEKQKNIIKVAMCIYFSNVQIHTYMQDT